jgi:exosortase/archaeosortase family protein
MKEKIIESYRKLPVAVRKFLVRATILIIVWKLLYFFVLNPIHVPDKMITDATAFATAKVIGWFHFVTSVEYMTLRDNVFLNGRKVLGIAHDCNGLELFVLYIGFLLCIPTTVWRVLLFSIAGISLVYILNVFRCVGLVMMTYHGSHWVDFAHHYAFKMVIYAVIFGLWVLYSKKYNPDAA